MVGIDISHYNTGTASIAANGTEVTGQGTLWASAIRPGDLFGTHKGAGVRIASVNSNVSLTLAYPWVGGAQSDDAYEIQRTPYDLGYQKAVEDLLSVISEGNLPMFGALVAAANKLPFFDTSGSMATADFLPWAQSMLALPGAENTFAYLSGASTVALTALTAKGRTILGQSTNDAIQTEIGFAAWARSMVGLAGVADRIAYLSGANTTALTELTAFARTFLDDADAATARVTLGANNAANLTAGTIPDARISALLTPDKAFRRGNVRGSVTMASSVPTGALIEESLNSNGRYVRFADGTQICYAVRTLSGTGSNKITTWTFPAAFVAAGGHSPIVMHTPNAEQSWNDGQGIFNGGSASVEAVGSTSATLAYGRSAGAWDNAKTIGTYAMAIGRWN